MRVQLGFLPPMYLCLDWRQLEGGAAGYLAFSLFTDAEKVMNAAIEAIRACADCRGFIIDLRGNPGGIAGMAMGLSGFFIGEKGRRLGTMHTRDTTVRLAVLPRPEQFQGPLVILVDECSASTSEIFAGGMQDLERARLFGARTSAGNHPYTGLNYFNNPLSTIR